MSKNQKKAKKNQNNQDNDKSDSLKIQEKFNGDKSASKNLDVSNKLIIDNLKIF